MSDGRIEIQRLARISSEARINEFNALLLDGWKVEHYIGTGVSTIFILQKRATPEEISALKK